MGERPEHPLESATSHLRRLYEASPGNEEGGWFARLEFEEQGLLAWAEDHDCLGGEDDLIPDSDLAGVEHRVRLDKANARVFKCTHPETYGAVPSFSYDIDDRTGRALVQLVLGKGTPLLYLERWRLFNHVFGDDVRLEKVIAVGYGLSILVSQRDISGEAPELAEIARYFQQRGFVAVPDACDAWYRASDDILALDAHQANLVRTAEGLVPIDIPTFHPDQDTAQWLRRKGL